MAEACMRFAGDELGTVSRQSLIDEGVDISAARIVTGATNQFAVVLVDARTGERTVLWDRHPALTMTAEEIAQEAVTSGRVLIVDCQETAAATQAARYARDAGLLTAIGAVLAGDVRAAVPARVQDDGRWCAHRKCPAIT